LGLGVGGLGSVWSLGFGVWGVGFSVWGLGFRVWGLGLEVWVTGCGVQDLGFDIGVWGLGFTMKNGIATRKAPSCFEVGVTKWSNI